ncbi:MAG: hypothetical protein AB1649_11970 [Chloroflexota bacterium]
MKRVIIFRKFLLLALSFLLASIACSFGAAASTPTPEPTPTITITSTPTLRPTPTLTPTPFYDVGAGQIITVKSGGFNFDLIKGYETVFNEGSVFYARSGDERVEIYFVAYVRPSGQALSTVMKNDLQGISDEYQDFVATEPVRASEDGVDSISAEFTARNGVFPVEGRVLIHEPDHSKLVYLLITAEGDQRWEREGQKVFEMVRGSLQFFRITAADDCSQPQYPDYGQKPQRPIPIGGGQRESASRIANYLDVLLGPNEELISYYELSETAQEFPGVVLYNVEYRSIRKTYYFDTKNYEPLTAPLGMKCSAPLPGKP